MRKSRRSEKRSAFRHGLGKTHNQFNYLRRMAACSLIRPTHFWMQETRDKRQETRDKRQENVDLSRFYVKTGVGFL